MNSKLRRRKAMKQAEDMTKKKQERMQTIKALKSEPQHISAPRPSEDSARERFSLCKMCCYRACQGRAIFGDVRF